jgi:thioesterase domain-containing protein
LSQPPKVGTSSLVLLNASGGGSPVFLANGLGGYASGLSELVRLMQASQPVYGIEPRGINGLDEPQDRIEDMAEFHLEAIRQTQPRGPYFLIGYSLGGLLTLEIAQRLSQNGERIALLAMLDSYPNRRYLSFGQHARVFLRLAGRRAASLMQIGIDRNLPINGDDAANGLDPLNESTRRSLQRLKEYQYRALRSYRPRYYDGKVNFVQARIRSVFPDDPVAVWSPLVKKFEMETLDCDHRGLLITHVASLASLCSRYVEQAQ